jgi:hypothetical protein
MLTSFLRIDPTRRVFENTSPYIFVGANAGEYDLDGNVLRAQQYDSRPFPQAEADEPIILQADGVLGVALKRSVGKKPKGGLTRPQCFWLANLSLFRLEKDAYLIYAALKAAQCGAYIPTDNWQVVVGK